MCKSNGLVALRALLVWSAGMCSAASSEADPIQQALLLVDLLKTEYARVKGENIILRKRELDRRTADDDPTCPPTEPSESSTFAGRRAYVQHGSHVTPHPRASKKNIYKSRRLEYDDAFGPHPGGDDPNKPDTSAATTAPPATASTTISTTPRNTPISTTSHTSEVTKITSTLQEQTTAKITSTTSGTTIIKNPPNNLTPPTKPESKNIPLKYKKTSAASTRDPVMEQVASEIINEMKDSKTARVKNYAFYSAPLFSAKTEKITRFENFTRGTLRIHQATSKRYPLPLPENNAFCFFHPESGLCRTFI